MLVSSKTLLGYIKRRQIAFYRNLLIILMVLTCISFITKSRNWGIGCRKSGMNKDLLKIYKERKAVLQENGDEFLEVVLRESIYYEVDLLENELDSSPYAAIYDAIIAADLQRIKHGWAENGTLNENFSMTEMQVQKTLNEDGFNRVLAEMISVNRSVPDNREPECRKIHYNINNLATMSVIIIYNNEAFISIVRTIHSVINRTPSALLREIILVDDFSDRLDLQEKLARYLTTKFPRGKVRLLKLSQRSGLIRARMIGAHVAIGDVLIFLDAHCETGYYWAEPLLQRIKEKRNVIASPVIEMIFKDTLVYAEDESSYIYVGGFSWSGLFYWLKVPGYEEKRKRLHHEATRTPVIAGGLFAVERKYFWEIGSYDPGMQIWGGENVEISFRVWMCGGTVEIIPCSRVGHIFRDIRPYEFPKAPADSDTVGVNTARVAQVWMDSYKSLFYLHRPEINENTNIGDITKRMNLRKKLNCHSFQWFLDNVYKEKFKSYLDSEYYGQIRNPKTNMCLDNMQNEEQGTYFLELFTCHTTMSPSQLFFLSKESDLRKEFACASNVDNQVKMVECNDEEPLNNEKWSYSSNTKSIIHVETGKCLTLRINEEEDKTKAVLESCTGVEAQVWEFLPGTNNS